MTKNNKENPHITKTFYRSSISGYVQDISIDGPFREERQRLAGDFTDEERQWRKQWVKDQKLAPDEPRVVPTLNYIFYNPIRRFYRKPMDLLEQHVFLPVMKNKTAATVTRMVIPKMIMMVFGIYWWHYTCLYNKKDWETAFYWDVMWSKPVEYPMPAVPTKPKSLDDYHDLGFKETMAKLKQKREEKEGKQQ